jgi:hypothetical protein
MRASKIGSATPCFTAIRRRMTPSEQNVPSKYVRAVVPAPPVHAVSLPGVVGSSTTAAGSSTPESVDEMSMRHTLIARQLLLNGSTVMR